MKYGVQLGGGAGVKDKAVLNAVGQQAEAAGYEAILIGDHIVFPKKIDSYYPYLKLAQEQGQDPYTLFTQMEWLDSFTVLALLINATETIRLGTSVTIIPYRHPQEMARVIMTLDVLSGGRFILGAGTGWMKEEFELLDVPFEKRGKRTDEYIEVMKKIWTEDDCRFDGEFIKIPEELHFAPKPIQKPYPPIWVGGESLPALKRVVKLGNGWHIGPLARAEIGSKLDTLKRLMDEAGRDYSELEITALIDGSNAREADIKGYADMGIDCLFTMAAATDPEVTKTHIDEFAKMVQDVS